MAANQLNQDEVARVITLVKGMMEGGRSFYWCYVAVKPSRYEEFKKTTADKYNIQNFVKDGFGEVIVSAEGREPPAEITQKVAEMFGVAASSLFNESDPLASIAAKLKEAQG